MELRNVFIFSIGLCTVWLTGCGVDRPESPPVAAESRPPESPPPEVRTDISGRYFLLDDVFEEHPPTTLTGIHNRYVEDFIRKPGLGLGRMALPPQKPQSHWPELVSESQGDRNPGADRAEDQPVKYDAVTETLTEPDGTIHTVRERVWLLTDWNLMSVNAESGPAVYSASARRKDEGFSKHDRMTLKQEVTGATAPKRPLDAFETRGLKKLHRGEEVVLQSSGSEMRVLGAIRARTECLACHKVDVGAMLGAFTYTLKLQSEETPEADRLKDTAGLTAQELGAVQAIESRGGKVIRAPGGPVTELQLTFARNQEAKSNFNGSSTRVKLHDSALAVVGAFPEIHSLDVSNSLVSDAGLKMIAELKHLKKLDLTGTEVTTEGVAGLKKALPACEILHNAD